MSAACTRASRRACCSEIPGGRRSPSVRRNALLLRCTRGKATGRERCKQQPQKSRLLTVSAPRPRRRAQHGRAPPASTHRGRGDPRHSGHRPPRQARSRWAAARTRRGRICLCKKGATVMLRPPCRTVSLVGTAVPSQRLKTHSSTREFSPKPGHMNLPARAVCMGGNGCTNRRVEANAPFASFRNQLTCKTVHATM